MHYPTWAHVASMPHVMLCILGALATGDLRFLELVPPIRALSHVYVIEFCVSHIAMRDDIRCMCAGFS